MGRRDLNTKYTILTQDDMNACDVIMNARWQRHFDWDEKPQWDT